jgi:SAM-dependent methyltransferase
METGSEQAIQAMDFVALSGERGQRMASFVEHFVQPLQTSCVLDVGCRYGGISGSFSRVARQVTAIDLLYNQVRQAFGHVKGQVTNLTFACANGLALPFRDNTFDLVILNGVLEWVGVAGTPRDPRDMQKGCLQEARRVLREGGILYLAIENRLYPGYILRDAHVGVPLVGILPRRMANCIMTWLYQKPYRTFIYSYWELKRLVHESGFASSSVYVPIYTYWYPCVIQPISDGRGILRSLADLRLADASERYRRSALVTRKQRLFFRFIASLGLQKMFCNALVVIAQA